MLKANRVSTLTLALWAAVSLLAAAPGAAFAKEKAKEAKFDFAKTKSFMKEMESRPDFPVSVVLADDYVYTMKILQGTIDAGKKAAVVSYLKQSQQKNGGFVADRANNVPSLLFTNIALHTLQNLQATGSIDAAGVRSFVASLKNRDGGFGFSPQSKGSTLASTCLALEVLEGMGGLSAVDKARTAGYLKGFERKGGGFGYVKGAGGADAKNTYLAVNALESIGMLDEGTRKGALGFLASTVYLKKGGKQRPELDEQLYAIRALKTLRATGKIDARRAVAFMRQLYIPVNGGFGPLAGYGSTPDSTTTALRILSEIGILRSPVAQVARK